MRNVLMIIMSVATIFVAMLLPPAAIVAVIMFMVLCVCAVSAVATRLPMDIALPPSAPLLALADLRAPPRR